MTAPLPIGSPEVLGVDPQRWSAVQQLLTRWIETDKIPAAAVCLGRRGMTLPPLRLGRLRPDNDSSPLPHDPLFLVASLTKPMTVAAMMILLERGELTLDDPVTHFLPRFSGSGKQEVQIRHLMTHTSGLPDMVPNNQKLRMEHRPLSDFVEEIYLVPLRFAPGTSVSYQSTGFALMGEIVHQITGLTLPEFLHRELFEPLGMSDTRLGFTPAMEPRLAVVRTAPELQNADWHWNSNYWRSLGAPWGGLITSLENYARFCQLFLNEGSYAGVRILSPASVRAMTCNQLQTLPDLPEEERRCRPWGLGWRLNWPSHSSNFGDLLGPRSYGHWGATGTLAWIDPDLDAFCLIFTTQPQETEGRFLARLSNAILAALR